MGGGHPQPCGGRVAAITPRVLDASHVRVMYHDGGVSNAIVAACCPPPTTPKTPPLFSFLFCHTKHEWLSPKVVAAGVPAAGSGVGHQLFRLLRHQQGALRRGPRGGELRPLAVHRPRGGRTSTPHSTPPSPPACGKWSKVGCKTRGGALECFRVHSETIAFPWVVGPTLPPSLLPFLLFERADLAALDAGLQTHAGMNLGLLDEAT